MSYAGLHQRSPSCFTSLGSEPPFVAAIPTVREHTRAPRRTFLRLAEPLEDIVAQNRLREIPGVGDAIADIVTKLHRTGRHPALDAMRTEIPAGTLELLTVPGLRPDKALKLYKELGISSVEDLEQAAKQERLKNVKGLGSALQRKILQGIEIKRPPQRHLHRATARTTTDHFRMSLVGSSYEIIAGDEGRFPMGTPDPMVGLITVACRGWRSNPLCRSKRFTFRLVSFRVHSKKPWRP